MSDLFGSSFVSAKLSCRRRELAEERARADLEAKGVYYPTWTHGKDVVKHYDEVQRYGEMLAERILFHTKPILEAVPKPAKPNTEWGRPYYD